jgi:ribosomal protein S18 acetylase RimI-like enzyme
MNAPDWTSGSTVDPIRGVMTMVKIRTMTKEDLHQVVGIHKLILQGSEVAEGEPDLELEFMDLMTSYPEGCLVAAEHDRVHGFIMASQKHWGFGLTTSGWVELVGVHPNYMGAGVGKMLGRAILEHFNSQGIENVYTAVKWDYADLITFFKSIGFGRSEFINLKYTGEE